MKRPSRGRDTAFLGSSFWLRHFDSQAAEHVYERDQRQTDERGRIAGLQHSRALCRALRFSRCRRSRKGAREKVAQCCLSE